MTMRHMTRQTASNPEVVSGFSRTLWGLKPALMVLAAFAVTGGACGRQVAPQAEGSVTFNITSWTDKTELYMEYPPLVTKQDALFAVHLTRLQDFTALDVGRPWLEFTPETGGAPVVMHGSTPSRPGAFRIEGAPPAPGRYTWALIVDAPGLADRHDLGTVMVFADEQSAKAGAAASVDDPAAIAYLKEQQWTNEFATEPVREAELRTSIRVPAVIEPVTGGEAIVAAPAPGRFAAETLLSIGSVVRAGQALGSLEPRLTSGDDRATLVAAVAETQAAADGARAEQARAERLLADRAVPARRVEEARRAVTVADARLHAAQARLAQRDETLGTGGGVAAGNAFVLRAPISGRLAEVNATLGAAYDEGDHLFKIVRTDEVRIRAQVPATDVAIARNAAGLALEFPGRSEAVILQPHHVRDAGVLDQQSRALALQFEVHNPGGHLLVGQSAMAVLYGRDRQRLLVVPKAAVLTEAGRPYVFVQVGGERFARQPIEIAARDNELVGVKSGVRPGDRVVIKGAYDIQLASAAKGLPAEAHVH